MVIEKPNTYFKITYREPSEGKIVTLKARNIVDSSLGLSFFAVSDFVFDTNAVVVDPSEEQLAKRFENTRCLHLSIYSVVSVEEVGAENSGLSFEKDKSNLVVIHRDGAPDSNP